MLAEQTENAALIFAGLGLPVLFPLCQDEIHLLRRLPLTLDADNGENAAGYVDLNQVALFHQGDRPAGLRLGAAVADHGTGGGAGKASC